MSTPTQELSAVRSFWNSHIHDWKVAKSEVGTAEFFAEIEAYRFEKLHYLPKLVDFSGYANKAVLDLGCGVGNDLSRFAKGGSRVVGVDLAEHSIELAQVNFRQRGLSGAFLIMDGERLGFSDGSFDLVYCHTVLHFTPDPEAMVREIHRVLKPGGLAILMTVNRRSWLNLLHKLAKVKIDHLDSPVFYRYTRKEFAKLLACFDDVEVIPERFPVKTKVHSGWTARLFDAVFVRLFNILPKRCVRWCGHHLMAFATKAPASAAREPRRPAKASA